MSLDALISGFDRALRTIAGVAHAARPNPAGDSPEPELSDVERRHAAALMRINHCGEVCAQALYQGQALATKDPAVQAALARSASEEEDHLAWCQTRIAELGGRTSVLNPLWYAGSLAIGFAAGKLGDQWNLGFLRETERQVETHLQGHLERLSPNDTKTRPIIATMQLDEINHARTAEALGASELPATVRLAMRLSSRVMTGVTYYV